MEIEVSVRRFRLRLVFVFSVALLTAGFLSWRTYRWDQPWLRPLKGYDQFAIRFEGLSTKDKEFDLLRQAFLLPPSRATLKRTTFYGFTPSDMGSDQRVWPSRYAWINMVGYVEPSQRSNALQKLFQEVDVEIRKTGLKVDWKMALVARDGSVIYPD